MGCRGLPRRDAMRCLLCLLCLLCLRCLLCLLTSSRGPFSLPCLAAFLPLLVSDGLGLTPAPAGRRAAEPDSAAEGAAVGRQQARHAPTPSPSLSPRVFSSLGRFSALLLWRLPMLLARASQSVRSFSRDTVSSFEVSALTRQARGGRRQPVHDRVLHPTLVRPAAAGAGPRSMGYNPTRWP